MAEKQERRVPRQVKDEQASVQIVFTPDVAGYERTPDAISYRLGVPVKLYGPLQEGGLCSFQLSVGDWTCDGTAQGADLEAARESLLEQARAVLEKVAAGEIKADG